jgi:hypothetical protein
MIVLKTEQLQIEKKINKYKLSYIIIIVLLFSCQHKESNNSTVIENGIHKTSKKVETLKDKFEFVEYTDEGDNNLLYSKKEGEDFVFITGDIDYSILYRGDICEIQWKKDTVYLAGDDESAQIINQLISIKKIQDGTLSKFIKTYNKELKYHWSGEDGYSDDYLNKLYLVAQYYIANSKNESIKSRVKKKEEIEYSIEEQTMNNRAYEVLGIGYSFESHFTLMQWIYYDIENHKIYEYDLPNDKLNEFK